MAVDESPTNEPKNTLFVPDLSVVGNGGSVRDGLSIPGFDFVAKLGEGGMGVVYQARDLKNDRDVAVKVAPPGTDLGSREMVRFLAEVETVSAIRHPHVIHVFEYGEYAGRPYLIMEYLTGGSLTDRLEQGPLEPIAAARLLADLARAVHSAHSAGIVHRDLKPRNILFAGDGEPRVTDFGIAKRSASDLTATQEVMGTPAYMAPEQAKGGTKFVGPPADVWALGAILYEAITGERPFNGAGINSVLYRVVHDEPTPPCVVRAGIPRDLERICLKCLQKEPNDRYQTADLLAEDLTNFVEGRPVSVRPPSLTERLIRWARTDPNRAMAYVLTALVVGLIGIGTMLSLFWQKAENARSLAVTAASEADAARKRTEETLLQLDNEKRKSDELATMALRDRDAAVLAQREEAEAKKAAEQAREHETELRRQVERALDHTARIEYSKLVDLAHREMIQGNNPERARELLASCPPKYRGWEWNFLHRMLGPESQSFLGENQGPLVQVRYSSDGKTVLTASADGTARVWNSRTGVCTATLRGSTRLASAAFNRDATRVATAAADGKVTLWDVTTSKPTVTIPAHHPVATSVAFSPDGAKLVTTGWDRTVKIWETKKGTPLLSLGAIGYHSAQFNGDGTRILTAGSDGTPRIWAVDTGKELSALRGVPQPLRTTAYSRDGSHILAAWASGTLRVLRAETNEELAAFEIAAGLLDSAISDDGAMTAAIGSDGILRVWDVNTKREVNAFPLSRSGVKCLAFRPDGKALIVGDSNGHARLLEPTQSPDESLLSSAGKGLETLAFDNEGRRLLVRRPDKSIGTIDSRNGEGWVPLSLPAGVLTAAAFSPNGRTLALVGESGIAGLWDAASGQAKAAFPAGAYECAVWSADGAQVLAGLQDGSALLWDVRSQKPRHMLQGPKSATTAAAFSGDGQQVTTVYHNGVGIIWETETGKAITDFRNEKDGLGSVAFFPDGQRVVTASLKGVVRIWDAKSGLSDGALGAGRAVGCTVAMNSEGTRIVTGSPLGWVRLWDTASGAEVFEREVSRDRLDVVQFSPDGRKLMAGTRGAKIVVWDSALPKNASKE